MFCQTQPKRKHMPQACNCNLQPVTLIGAAAVGGVCAARQVSMDYQRLQTMRGCEGKEGAVQ